MRWVSIVLLGCVVSLLPGCKEDTDQYSGLSKMVAERQEVRKNISEKNLQKKKESDHSVQSRPKEEDGSTSVLYEKKIDILDSQSGMQLARGVAYLNKNGDIVKIKVVKE